LAGERGGSLVRDAAHRAFWHEGVAVQTRIIDDFLCAELTTGGFDAVVSLGAGFDTRPYRLSIPPNVRWIEVDSEEIFAHKNSVLDGYRPQCAVERNAFDVTDDDARRKLLDSLRGRNALMLTEGLLNYLTVSAVDALAADLGRTAAVRSWILDHTRPEVTAFAAQTWPFIERGVPLAARFAPDDVAAYFARSGWEITRSAEHGIASASFGRFVPQAALHALAALTPPEMAEAARRRTGCIVMRKALT